MKLTFSFFLSQLLTSHDNVFFYFDMYIEFHAVKILGQQR